MAEPLGVLYVRWIDATMDGHWGDEADPRKLAEKTASPCQSIGFLIACFFLGGNFRSGGSVKVNTEPKT